MSDVFISYSRRDQEFVHLIYDRLVQAGRNAWVDWEGIPPSAEWMKEITAAIEAAHSVLCVVSGHFAASEICAEEIQLSARNNKRLIPIVREDVDPARLPRAVAQRNWIFFRESDDFDRSFALLISALDTDLDWLKFHTRLLMRAVEWQAHRRDYGYALHGSDLQQSERRLTLVAEKEPQLTSLQIEYVLQSRRDADRRRNIALGAASIAATVLIVVALLFWQQKREAALNLAQSNLNLARDFREKAMGELAKGDPLSAEVYFAHSLGIDDALETRQLLLEARAKAARLLWTYKPQAAPLLAFSADGTRFLAQNKASLEIWDVRARQRVQSLPIGKTKLLAAAFSRNGDFIAIADEDSISVWRMGNSAATPVATIDDANPATSVAIAPTGEVVVAGSSDGTMSIWDLQAPKDHPLLRQRSHQNRISSLAFTPDGQFLASGSWDNSVKLWSVVTEKEQRTLSELRTLNGHDDAVLSVAFSPDGNVVATGSWDNRIWLWDRRTGQQLRQLVGHTGGILSLAFSADGQWIASGSEDHNVRVWAAETGRLLLALPGAEGNVTATTFVAGQGIGQLVVADETGTIRLWDLDAIGQRDELTTLRGHQRPVSSLMFNPQQNELVSGGWDRTIRLWNLTTKMQRSLVVADDPGHTDSVTAVRFSPDGRWIASASKDTTIRLWDVETGSSRQLRGETGAPAIVRDVAFSPDGAWLASGSDDGHIRVWTVADGRLVRDFPAGHNEETPAKILGIAFSPDGQLFAAADEEGKIGIWRMADWSLLHILSGHEAEIWQVVFSRDGRLLFSASDDRTARVWDVASGKQLGKPLVHEGPVWGVDVALDGSTLATGSSDSTAHIWTFTYKAGTVEVTPRFTLMLSDDPIWTIGFSRKPGDTLLALSGADRTIRVLNVNRLNSLFDDPQKLEQQARRESGLEIVPGPDLRIAPVHSIATDETQ